MLWACLRLWQNNSAVLWIGIVLMPIRSRNRLFILMPIRIRILPQVLHMLENLNFFLYNSLQCQFALFWLFHQCHRWHNFLYFGQPILVKCSISLHRLEMDTDPDRKVLDADHDTYHPAKWCWSDRIRMNKTANLGSTAILICTVTYRVCLDPDPIQKCYSTKNSYLAMLRIRSNTIQLGGRIPIPTL